MAGPDGKARPQSLSPELSALLSATSDEERAGAWSVFVASYHGLIMKVARQGSPGHDNAMDRYTHVLEGLRKDDFRRLRGYADDTRGKFTTWLVVVATRLCEDHRRSRFGRARVSAVGDRRVADRQEVRKRIADLVAAELDAELTPDDGGVDAEMRVRQEQLHEALTDAVRTLGPRDRLLLELRFRDGLSAREVADVLGLATPFHVYRRVNACLRQLRAAMEAHGFSDPRP